MKYEIDINEELQKRNNGTCAVLDVSENVKNNSRVYSCASVSNNVNTNNWTCASSRKWMSDYAHMHSLNE
jgi:lipopolysaccharide biosynthesis regulator YciM